MANDLRLKLNLLRCLLHPLSISLRPQQKTCTPYAARGAIVSKSPALFTAKTAIYWGILGISPFLRTFSNRDTVWKAVFSASKMAFCLKMQNKIPHRFGPWRIASGPFLFAYISLPSGNMNPTRAFAPRASAICCHSSTVNLPVFIRLLSSRVISVPRPGSPLGKTKKAAEISRPNLNWRTYQYA